MTVALHRWLRDRADERRAVAEYRLAWRRLRVVRAGYSATTTAADAAQDLVSDHNSHPQEGS